MIGTPDRIIETMIKLMKETPDKLYEVREHRQKRSLTQNAYYWALIGEVSRALRMTTTELHNRMLRDVSDLIAEEFGGKKAYLLLPDTDETERKALASETVHIKPTAQTKVLADGITYRTYVLLKGSHDMNTREMSALVDRLVDEAKQLGIETLTWKELLEMRERERKREERNAEKHYAGLKS